MDYAEIELELERRDAAQYLARLRFTLPGDDGDQVLAADPRHLVVLTPEALRENALDPAAYGRTLESALRACEPLREALDHARARAAGAGCALRLRLLVSPTAPELHAVRWETLFDSAHDAPLLVREDILFSRYLVSSDWQPVRVRPKGELRVLAAVASPAGLAKYGLAPVDAAGELARIRAAVGDTPVTQAPGTLNGVIDALRDGPDVLYLVCHGAFAKGEPRLWLEDADGNVAVTAGHDLVARLSALAERPRLVVLASCQSAGTGGAAGADRSDPLGALGPRLAEAGIPAVVVMNGDVSMETIDRFMPVFFRELVRDGQIDRAMAAARAAVSQRPDWWMPVLYLRLRSGRLWYVPGFGTDGDDLKVWPAILRNVQYKLCTPLLGPGLLDPLWGVRSQLALRWAETYGFPLAAHQRDDLPLVAQYLAIHQDAMFPRTTFVEDLRRGVTAHIPDAAQAQAGREASLDALLEAAWRARVAADGAGEPFTVLAALPSPIYVTVNPDSLLEIALRDAGRRPRAELCRWNDDLEILPSVFDEDPAYQPSVEEPLVYYLFGRLGAPDAPDALDTLVLTEDDHFDFLAGFARKNDLVPASVKARLVNSALLFLGFHVTDWSFRLLLRGLQSLAGADRRRRYAHIAAQVDPEDERIVSPKRARAYLEACFQRDANINVYWGTVASFLAELHARLPR